MFSRFAPPEPLLGAQVPLEGHLTDQVLRLSDDGAYAMFEVQGLPAETADDAALAAHLAQLHSVWLNIAAADRLVVSTYLCRSLADPAAMPPPDGRLTSFARGLAASYRDRLLDGLLYENRLFLGLHLRPLISSSEWWARRRARKHGAGDLGERAIDRARTLSRLCDWLATELAEYGLRRLGVVQRGRQMFSEIAEAQAFAATGVWRPVALSTGRLGAAMFAEEVAFHYETVELRGPGYTQYVALLSLKEYPALTWPGLLADIERAPFRCTLTQHFEPLSRSAGISVLTRKQNKMVWAGDKARSQIAELDDAADRVASGRMGMGAHCLSLAVFADRAGSALPWYRRFAEALRAAGLGPVAAARVEAALDDATGGPARIPLDEVANAAWKTLANCGASVARENRALMAAWLSQLAGNHRLRLRPGACSTRNFAAFAPLHGPARGRSRSRWGAPILMLRTSAGTAYPFHWHDGEGDDAVGNTLITGETGSGKTTLVGALIAGTAGRADVIGLDHKQGWRVLFGHLGAPYAVMGGGQPMFAPLQALTPTPGNLDFLFELFRGCIRQGGWRALSPEEERLLALGLHTVMENPPEHRRLAEVAAFLAPAVAVEGAGARLLTWCWGQELGWVLDAPRDALDLAGGLLGLDATEVLTNARAAPPTLLYLFHRIGLHLDGRRRLLLPVDEGWRVLEDPAFYRPIAAQLRTIRSKNGVVVFITQSPADAANSPIAAELLEQCPNQIHLPNPRASEADYVGRLKRTPGEFAALRGLQKGSGQFLLCKGRDSLIAELPLRGLPQLPALAASEAALRRYEAIPAEVRTDPRRLEAEYRRRTAGILEEVSA